MSNDAEARLLDLEFGFANLLKSTIERFEDIKQQSVDSTVETANVIAVVLEELIEDTSLDREHLTRAMEVHASTITDAGPFSTRRTAVETVLAQLKRGGTRANGNGA